MVSAVMFVLIVGSMLIVYLRMGGYESQLVGVRIKATQALYCADSGIEYARFRLSNKAEWISSNWGRIPVGDIGAAEVQFIYSVGSTAGRVISTGIAGNISRRIEAVIDYEVSPFERAVCGVGSIQASGNATTNCYDGAAGPYDEGSATGCGDIASNVIINLRGNTNIQGNVTDGGNLNMKGNANIQGDVTTGGKVNLRGKAAITGSITDNVNPAPSPCDPAIIDIDDKVAQAAVNNDNRLIDPGYLTGTEFRINGNKSVTFPAGTYYFTDFRVSGQATVNIAAGDTVNIYFSGAGPFNITGHGTVNVSDNTARLRIYSNSSAKIKLSGNSSFAGTVFSPYADIKLAGNNIIYGAIFAKGIHLSGNTKLHYDTSLTDAGGGGNTVTAQIISWRETIIQPDS